MSNVMKVACTGLTLEGTIFLGIAQHATDCIADFETGYLCFVTQRNNIAREVTTGTEARWVRGVNKLC